MISNKHPDKMNFAELVEEKEMMLEILIQYRNDFPFTCTAIENDLQVIQGKLNSFQKTTGLRYVPGPSFKEIS